MAYNKCDFLTPIRGLFKMIIGLRYELVKEFIFVENWAYMADIEVISREKEGFQKRLNGFINYKKL